MEILGEFQCKVKLSDQSTLATITVVPNDLLLLGADLVDTFSLWGVPMDSFCKHVAVHPDRLTSFKESFPKVFSGTFFFFAQKQISSLRCETMHVQYSSQSDQ